DCRNPSCSKALSPNPREKIPRFLKKILWEVLRNLLRSCRGRAFKIINSRLVVTPEAGAVHSPTCFGTLHECFPDEAGSSVLRHEYGDFGMNSNQKRRCASVAIAEFRK